MNNTNIKNNKKDKKIKNNNNILYNKRIRIRKPKKLIFNTSNNTNDHTLNIQKESICEKIHNLTDMVIPPEIENILHEGGKYRFDTHILNKEHIQNMLEDFKYKYKIKVLQNMEILDKSEEKKTRLYKPLTDRKWIESYEENLSHLTKTFIQTDKLIMNLFNKDKTKISTNMLKRRIRHKHNIHILKEFINNNDITIKPADKNMGLTVININHYHELVIKQLNDKCYKQITPDTIPSITTLSNTISDYSRKLYDKQSGFNYFNYDEFTYITRCLKDNKETKIINTFYILPKIHKSPITGRPITNAKGNIFQPISKILSRKLQTLLDKEHTILRNSMQLIIDMEDYKSNITKDTDIVTFDIEALYPSIPLHILMISIQWYLHRHGIDNQITNIIMEITKLIINNTYINYNNTIFKQISGVAMGNSLSPTLANVFMLFIELQAYPQLLLDNNILYRRYLDDIFIMGHIDKEQIIKNINVATDISESHIKYKTSMTGKTVNFLDINITLMKDNHKFITRIYEKPGHAHQYIRYDSTHPKYMYKNIVKTEIIRMLKLNTTSHLYQQDIQNMIKHFIQRQYKYKDILILLSDIKYENRDNWIQNNGNQKTEQEVIYIKLPYSRTTNFINKVILQVLHDQFNKDIILTKILPISLNNIIMKTYN